MSAAGSAFLGEAHFCRSTIVPTGVWASTTTVQTGVSRGNSQRLWLPLSCIPRLSEVCHLASLVAVLRDQVQNQKEQGSETPMGKTHKWIPFILLLWWIVWKCCDSVEDAWRLSFAIEHMALFSVLKLWPAGQLSPPIYFPSFLVSLFLFLHSSCPAAAPLCLPQNVL